MGFGFAYVNGGWILDAPNRLRRAESTLDRMRRLLRPLWGPVWQEPSRGNAAAPAKNTDAIAAIVEGRVRHVLEPLLRDAEISDLTIEAGAPDERGRVAVAVTGRDSAKQPFSLTVLMEATT